jgi:hypothetical protein
LMQSDGPRHSMQSPTLARDMLTTPLHISKAGHHVLPQSMGP